MNTVVRNVLSLMGLLLAVLLGIFAQDITYFLNEQIPVLSLTAGITLTTFMSVALFISILFYYLLSKKYTSKTTFTYMIISSFLGIPISLFSLLVFSMWVA